MCNSRSDDTTTIDHLTFGWLPVPEPKKPMAACHCLLLEDKSGLALVDNGIGLLDLRGPAERIGPELINMAVSGLRKQTQQYDRSNGWAIDLRTCFKSY